MEHLYDWWFTYNPHTEKWAACRTEDIPLYKNDFTTDRAIRSSRIETLQTMIIKGEGSIDNMKKIYKF